MKGRCEMYLIKAWVLVPEEHKMECTKYFKAKTVFTLALKTLWANIFYDYVEVKEVLL